MKLFGEYIYIYIYISQDPVTNEMSFAVHVPINSLLMIAVDFLFF